MEVTGSLQIVCPIRGQLKVNKRSKDGLSASEEFYRVEAIKYLLSRSYPKENFWIEPIRFICKYCTRTGKDLSQYPLMFFENSSLPKFLTIIFEIVFHELYNSLEFFDIQRRCQVLQIFILQLCQTPFQRFQRTCLSDETKQCFYKIIVFFIANHPSRRRVILDD